MVSYLTDYCLKWMQQWLSQQDKEIHHQIGGTTMKIAKDSIEDKMQIPGAIIRQKTDFGDATGVTL
jgi:hypothetical protein